MADASKQVTVFGASGKVGQLVVAELLARGYTVVAVVHNNTPFKTSDTKLHIHKCDVHDDAQVVKAISFGDGSQAVISTLGSWSAPSRDIVSSGISNIVPAMQSAGVRRVISLTGSGAFSPNDEPSMLGRAMHRFTLSTPVLGKVLRDGEFQFEILQDSGLDWTVLRSPVMTNGHHTAYRLSNKSPLPWAVIPRQSIAQAIVNQLDDHTHVGQSPFVVKSS